MKLLWKEEHDTFEGLATADVAIDFSVPKPQYFISTCFNENVPVISGTTGWFDQYDAMVSKCNEKKGALFQVLTLA
jgi:4-hydroxy-tetrahydrodipicolinate reductase